MSEGTEVFELVETVPNTEDWLAKRKGVTGFSLGSSGMGPGAGISPFKGRDEVVHELVYGSTFKGNKATEHGHQFEEACANRWSAHNKAKTFEVGICRPTPANPLFNDPRQPGYPFFGVSIDRWACTSCPNPTPDIRAHVRCKGFRVIECKCPYTRGSFERYYDRKIKDEHLAQLHLQMAVLGLRKIDYMVTLISSKGVLEEERLATVFFSQEFWDYIYPRALEVVLTAVEAVLDEKDPVQLEEVDRMPPKVPIKWKF